MIRAEKEIGERNCHLGLSNPGWPVDPIPIRKEITKEEKAHERIAGDYASEKKLSLLTVMQKKERKIAALMQGHTLPFNALFVVRV